MRLDDGAAGAVVFASLRRPSSCAELGVALGNGIRLPGQCMQFMRDLRRWALACFRWLMESWRVGILLLTGGIVLVLFSLVPFALADRLRYLGLLCQLLGIMSVVLGLRVKRRLFNRPSLGERFRHYLSRFPRWPPRPQNIAIGASIAGAGWVAGGGSVWLGPSPDAPVESRLAALEANLARLKTKQAEDAKELRETTRSNRESLESEREARRSEIAALRAQLDKLGAGGLHIEWAGVFLLALGVVLATVSDEIAAGLNGCWW